MVDILESGAQAPKLCEKYGTTRGQPNCVFPGCHLYGKYFLCTVIGMYVGDVRDTCTQCNVVNGTHVRDVEDTCMYL